jgi:UDP-N-acetyl-2-amino-2-deoxyglucuronate dehydrogenase
LAPDTLNFNVVKNFVLVGAAGYIAPRHMKAIRETGNNLVAAYDKSDSVGVLDSYFPDADFFVEFERFDRHLEKLKRAGTRLDFVSICSPNYLHDAHIRFGLRHGCDVICEKPLVLNPWNLDGVAEIEQETGRKIFNILQLRLHESAVQLKNLVDTSPNNRVFDIELTYIATRGKWYYASWKGDQSKSGGIATNIGIHFFDLLIWIFGKPQKNIVHIHTHDRAAGFLQLPRARVRWFLSINADTIPRQVFATGLRTYRSLLIENQEIEFSGGFTDLHTRSYEHILSGGGFRLDEAREAIQVVHDIRNARLSPNLGSDVHPLALLPLARHPFN